MEQVEVKKRPIDWADVGLKCGGAALVIIILGLLSLLVYRVGWFDFVDNYNLAYTYDLRSGKIERVYHTGYIRTPPIVMEVHRVDLRPMQVCINANERVLNCKLVQFNPDGLEQFLEWHGRGDYTTAKLNPILMSYAYDGSGRTAYPFLTILRELKPEEARETLKP